MAVRWAQHHLTTLILAAAILWRGDLWHQLFINVEAPRHWLNLAQLFLGVHMLGEHFATELYSLLLSIHLKMQREVAAL